MLGTLDGPPSAPPVEYRQLTGRVWIAVCGPSTSGRDNQWQWRLYHCISTTLENGVTATSSPILPSPWQLCVCDVITTVTGASVWVSEWGHCTARHDRDRLAPNTDRPSRNNKSSLSWLRGEKPGWGPLLWLPQQSPSQPHGLALGCPSVKLPPFLPAWASDWHQNLAVPAVTALLKINLWCPAREVTRLQGR